ncbi:unnamed protein product [Camellia sinensis]
MRFENSRVLQVPKNGTVVLFCQGARETPDHHYIYMSTIIGLSYLVQRTYVRLVRPIHIIKPLSDNRTFVFEIQTSFSKMRRGEQHGCGVEQVTLILVVAVCLIFLPLGMGPGPLGPPPLYVLLLFPVVAAVVFIFLSQAPK